RWGGRSGRRRGLSWRGGGAIGNRHFHLATKEPPARSQRDDQDHAGNEGPGDGLVRTKTTEGAHALIRGEVMRMLTEAFGSEMTLVSCKHSVDIHFQEARVGTEVTLDEGEARQLAVFIGFERLDVVHRQMQRFAHGLQRQPCTFTLGSHHLARRLRARYVVLDLAGRVVVFSHCRKCPVVAGTARIPGWRYGRPPEVRRTGKRFDRYPMQLPGERLATGLSHPVCAVESA